MARINLRMIGQLLAISWWIGCAGSGQAAQSSAPDQLAALLADSDRSPADRRRDLTSRPAEVLNFAGLNADMKVLDLLSGDGYYSEIIAGVVGPNGHVYMHNNQGYIGLQLKAIRRLRDGRLPNVEPFVREIGDIMLASNSVDLVLMNLVYHDLYYENNGWEVSADQVFQMIARVLKPEGVLLVVDHDAPRGSGSAFAPTLHRIEANYAITDIAARGLVFDASTSILYNPADDRSVSVFDPAIRGATSRFVLRFYKPRSEARSVRPAQ